MFQKAFGLGFGIGNLIGGAVGTVGSALAIRLYSLPKMASVCRYCEQQYTFDHFNSIISHSADVSFRQTITHGCLCKLLAWATAKKQSKKSSVGNTDDLPSDFSGIAHALVLLIQFIHVVLAAAVILHCS